MSEKFTMKVVQPQEICEIKISGSYLQRLHGIYFHYMKEIGEERTNLANQLIGKKLENPTDQTQIDAYNLETILLIIKEVEMAFDKQGSYKDEVIDPEQVKTDNDLT